jgi:hypothetical protein
MRVLYLLIRVQSLTEEENYPGEYHRYAVEIEPVQVHYIFQDSIKNDLLVCRE